MAISTDPGKTGIVLMPTRALVLGSPAITTPVGTGSLVETTLATYTMPANTGKAGQALRITALWSMTSSANVKTARIKFGGTTYSSNAPSSSLSLTTSLVIYLKTATSQIGPPTNLASGSGSSNAAPVTSSADLSTAIDISFTGEVTAVAETITLQAYSVEIIG